MNEVLAGASQLLKDGRRFAALEPVWLPYWETKLLRDDEINGVRVRIFRQDPAEGIAGMDSHTRSNFELSEERTFLIKVRKI